MSSKTTTKLSFQVTLQLPEGMTIKDTRAAIVDSLKRNAVLGLSVDNEVKVHLTNKETSYGKR
mgnify:CR=1 FL=1